MNKIMVGEKVNIPKDILYYQLQALKDMFNLKVKKNHAPYGMLFTQIMRNSSVDVSGMAPFGGATQLKGMTLVKLVIADNFTKYGQKHIK